MLKVLEIFVWASIAKIQVIIRVEVEIDAPKSNLMMGAAT